MTRVDEYLVAYLLLLGITIPPISSIYAVETLLFRTRFDETARGERPLVVYRSMLAWLLAIFAGYMAQEGIFSLTNVAALDSILVAAVLAVALRPLDALRLRALLR